MKKQLQRWLTATLMLALSALASASAPEHDHSVGTHGMALMSVGNQLLASHMPLHGSKHAHQIVLQLKAESNQTALNKLLAQSELVSIEPERFSLQQLRQGKLTKFTANVYQGHFERQGTKILEDVNFQVTKILQQNPIHDGISGHFEILPLDAGNALLIHRIGDIPSFDQIIWIQSAANSSSRHRDSNGARIFHQSSAPLTASQAAPLLQPLGFHWVKSLYLETADFSPR